MSSTNFVCLSQLVLLIFATTVRAATISSANESHEGSAIVNFEQQNTIEETNRSKLQQLPKLGHPVQLFPSMSRQPLNINRDDSYLDAAKEYQQQSYYQQPDSGYSSYGAPSTSYGVYGQDDGYDLDNAGNAGTGILGGLTGLIGLKGLKGLGILGILKAIALPAFFFILPLLLFLPILVLFLPIPIISIGGANAKRGGQSSVSILGYKLDDLNGKMSSISRAVLDSEKCVERVSCEISRYSQGTFMDRTLKRIIKQFEPMMPNSIQRMTRAYMDENHGCKRYGCHIMDDYKNNSLFKQKSN